ncbi:acetyl-CoA synthetase-like protein [Agrocybe pediades]|nr:acetyl-CoA synthetase-like protein [Agrocybe pediades]
MGSFEPLPNFPRTQALASETFSPPPLDGSILLPEMCDWHLQKSPNHPLFTYACQSGGIQTIYWVHAARAIHTGARIVRRTLGWNLGGKSADVIAILASSETISYYTLLMSIMRGGYTAFTISARNSPSAVAHLIKKVGVKHLFVGRDQAMLDLKTKAFEELDSELPTFSPIPTFEDLYTPAQEHSTTLDELTFEKKDLNDIAIYMHSSGSTNFPKPIAWTHAHLLRAGIFLYFGQRDFTGLNMSLHSVPMFHTMGSIQLTWTIATGMVINAFEPKTPAVIPTPQNFIEGVVACKSDLVLCVPLFLEEWCKKPEHVQALTRISGAIYAGGPLSKQAGEYLTSKGVQLFNLYGLTEVGPLTTVLPIKPDAAWDCFRFSNVLDVEMVPQGDGSYECVLLTNTACRPASINTTIRGADAYATSDLFVPQQDQPGTWKMYGRKDDQIVHSTGEKTNPGPLEHILGRDPHIRSAVIFGRGQFQAGVIIDPKPEFAPDVKDKSQLDAFLEKIWPTVKLMNEYAPQHSRIFKEMITTSLPSKPFQYTIKNTPRRQLIIGMYKEEINSLYAAADDSNKSSIPAPSIWEGEPLFDFVRSVVGKVLLHREVGDSDDIFQHGCDSLQATWIRNTIIKVLRDSTSVVTDNISSSFVYEHPTLAGLVSFLSKVVSGEQRDAESAIDAGAHAAAMRAMVQKYTVAAFPIQPRSADDANRRHNVQHASKSDAPGPGDVVLVTGTTGGLGTYILAELLADPEVRCVYAVNRGKDHKDLLERQEKALVQRGVDPRVVLESEKLVMLVADTSAPLLALPEVEYEKIRTSVTQIIHNAWPVDFKMSLASFENSIKGLRNLIELALSSPLPTLPTFVFASTIGLLQNAKSSEPIPETPVEAEIAVGNGYTEGKWVAEEILRYTSKHAGLTSTIVRVGQLAGGINGSWNATEWLPSLVQSAHAIGCLPTEGGDVDWIPVHIAAKAMSDYSRSGNESGSSTIVHLVHPRPVPWSTLASVLAQELSVPLVHYSEWLEKLESMAKEKEKISDSDITGVGAHGIHALRLLDFYRSLISKMDQGGNAFGLPRLSCTQAVKLSDTLSSGISPLGEEAVRSWLGFWKGIGFIDFDSMIA